MDIFFKAITIKLLYMTVITDNTCLHLQYHHIPITISSFNVVHIRNVKTIIFMKSSYIKNYLYQHS